MVNDLIIETNSLITDSDLINVNNYEEEKHQLKSQNLQIQRPQTLLTQQKSPSSSSSSTTKTTKETKTSSSSSSSIQRNQINCINIINNINNDYDDDNNVGNLSWKFFDQISLLDYQLRDDEEIGRLNNLDGDVGSNSREILLSKSNLKQSSKPIIIKQDNKKIKLSPSNSVDVNIMSSSGSPSGSSIGQPIIINPNYNQLSLNKKQQQQQQKNHHNLNENSIDNLRNDTMISSSGGSSSDNNKSGSGIRNTNLINSTNNNNNNNNNNKLQQQNNNNHHHQHHHHPQQQQQQQHQHQGLRDDNNMPQYGIGFHLGLFGWRKKCLYSLILVLMLLILVNLVLTLWILKVMEFSSEGMGQLKIVPGGIQLSGQALIMDLLRASTIRSKHGQPITLESSRNFSINTRDSQGILENQLFLGHDKLECLTTSFRINDTNGKNLFSVNRDEVTIGAHSLRIDGEGGAIFRESIQTPHIRAEAGRELRLESPTRQLEMTAAKDITLQSRAGGVDLTALDDVKLTASDGSIRLESSNIFLPNLKTAQLLSSGTVQNSHTHRVYQLCACLNGKLFLASPHSICAGDDSSVCR